jgi:hypothetical protein
MGRRIDTGGAFDRLSESVAVDGAKSCFAREVLFDRARRVERGHLNVRVNLRELRGTLKAYILLSHLCSTNFKMMLLPPGCEGRNDVT